MSKVKPLTESYCQAIQDAMSRPASLADITRETGVVSVIEFMLEDRSSLERYMASMAAALTNQRQQISHSSLLLSMFHYEMPQLSLYNVEFKDLLINTMENERKIQRRVFLAENHLQVMR